MEKEYLKVLEALYLLVLSEGGDGDAIWLLKLTPIKDIIQIIEKFNIAHQTNWQIIKYNENTINWGDNQEWVVVTNDEKLFNEQPSWVKNKFQIY